MSADIFLILLQDGLTNGAIYSLIAVALVLVFAVTRVIFVQSGAFVSFGALTLLALQQDRTPPTLWFMIAACLAVGVVEGCGLAKRRAPWRRWFHLLIAWALLPAALVAIVVVTAPARLPMPVQIAIALAIVTPMGPAMYRLASAARRRPDRGSARHLDRHLLRHGRSGVMDGLALFAFGPDGARTASFTDIVYELGLLFVPLQSLIVYAATIVAVAALFWISRHTMYGRALRATASNRRGAVLSGINPDLSGTISFALGSFIGASAGILIGPFVTIYYDSGFYISLKAFVGAMVGAMVSYPLAAAGAVVGVIESFAAFGSSAYKDVLVFALMVPILFGCSLLSRTMLDADDDVATESPRPVPARVERVLACLRLVPWSVWVAGVLLAMAALPFALSAFYVTLVSHIYLAAIVAYGVVLLTGVAGQLSFGQAAFVGVGAYASAMATTSCGTSDALRALLGSHAAVLVDGAACGVSPWLGLPIAMLATGLCALVLDSVTLRMRGHFLPIATITWAVSIFFLFANTDMIGGSTGMTDIPRIPLPSVGGPSYESAIYYSYCVTSFSAAGVAVSAQRSMDIAAASGRGRRSAADALSLWSWGCAARAAAAAPRGR